MTLDAVLDHVAVAVPDLDKDAAGLCMEGSDPLEPEGAMGPAVLPP